MNAVGMGRCVVRLNKYKSGTYITTTHGAMMVMMMMRKCWS